MKNSVPSTQSSVLSTQYFLMTPADKVAAAEVRRRFASEVSRPDASVDLARAALLVGAEEEPRRAPEVDLTLGARHLRRELPPHLRRRKLVSRSHKRVLRTED